MQEQKQLQTRYIVVVVLMLVNFFVSYGSFSSGSSTATTTVQDKLSGQQYAPVINEENPYGPYFVGFQTIIDRGVSGDDIHYIYDVLTNFTMYNQKQFMAKVSYVDNSFQRQTVSGIEPHYSLQFGVNDKDTHTLQVSSSILTNKITLTILNAHQDREFSKTFQIYTTYD